jgi:hypothetical protein
VQAFRYRSVGPSLESSILERISASVDPPNDVFTVGVNNQKHRVDSTDRALVRISADRATARYFWSTPPAQPSGTPE